MSPTEFERRASALLGGYGWQQRWATATGLSRQHVSKVVNGKATLPDWWGAIIEVMERVPQHEWPERWEQKKSA